MWSPPERYHSIKSRDTWLKLKQGSVNGEGGNISQRRNQLFEQQERERERCVCFLRQHFEPAAPLSVAGRAPHAQLSPAAYPPTRPLRTSPAKRIPHPHARNPLFPVFYATQ